MVVRSFDLGGKEGTRGFFVFFSSLSNFPPTPRPPTPLFLLRIWHMLWLAGWRIPSY
jgi:hypothetical protein